jgi:hypothetical protein
MAIVLPEFISGGSYNAKRWRRGVERLSNVQVGVLEGFAVTKDGSGWGFTVSGPGRAWVPANVGTPSNAGMYLVESDATPLTGTISPAHASLPRIDAVVIRVTDVTDSQSATNGQEIAVVQGTATSGATLGNRNGAAAIIGNQVHIADILVPGGSGSIAAATVRDRRPWSRGVFHQQVITSGDLTTAGGNLTEIARVRLNIGRGHHTSQNNLVFFSISGNYVHTVGMSECSFAFYSQVNDTGTWTQIGGTSHRYSGPAWVTNMDRQVHYVDANLFAPGNYLFRVVASTAVSTMTTRASATKPFSFSVREVPRPAQIISSLAP